jgi:ABC-2 type transport system ATP-binding protein
VIPAELRQVTKRFGATTALDGLSFQVGEGEAVALLGENGCGKSTAIAVLLGLRTPDAGQARLFGGDPRRPPARRHVGVALQEAAFPATMRVREVLELVRAHYERPVPAAELVERFELGRLVSRQVGGLSGGQRRRVAVAIAFAGCPRLVVLDEPTAGLDRQGRVAVREAIGAHVDDGGALLLATHVLEDVAALAARTVVIESGRVAAEAALGTGR